jgi:mannobiose 2-epimerase
MTQIYAIIKIMFNKNEVIKTVRENILPFWQGMTDSENGGFYGEADFYGKPDRAAPKGGILNSRILWTFSAAYSLFGSGGSEAESYRAGAAHARDFLLNAFLDRTHGGLYWLVDHTGKPLNDRKQFYNLAFGIYGLSEHYRATGDRVSLDTAYALFDCIEKYGADTKAGGYIEACQRDWSGIEDFRLSSKEINCPKSMNTILHILEAYTNLLRADGDKRVYNSLESLVHITQDKVINSRRNFNLFFDIDWNSLVQDVSWGHDIEGAWLLHEAALALGDKDIISRARQTALEIAEVIYNAAIDRENGGLLSGCDADGRIHPKKEWWPQAEAFIGFYYAYRLSGSKKYLDCAAGIWDFIQNHFIDKSNGEWHNEMSLDNKVDTKMPKAGFWKCPYHNARACLEVIKRMDE